MALNDNPFRIISSSAPGFNSSAADNIALEVEGTRAWQYPSNRTVRVTSRAADDFYICFGASGVTAASTASMLVLGGVSEVFSVLPKMSHVAIASSTDVTVNFTLGHGY
jgi:hypothetical protein